MNPSNQDSRTSNSVYTGLTLVVFGILLLVVLLTFGDYGMGWDEPWYIRYGQAILSFFASGGADPGAITPKYVPLARGGTFSVLVEGLATISPLDPFHTRKLVTALTGVTGIVGAAMVAYHVAGMSAAFWTLLLMALFPTYYGHMFLNPIDLPFAVGYIWALYFILRILEHYPTANTRLYLGFGLTLGLTMGTRFNGGVLLLGTFGLMWIVAAILQRRTDDSFPSKPLLLKTARAVAVALAVALVVMAAFWPKILTDPLFIVRAFTVETSFPKHEETLFLGNYVWSDALPRTYWIIYLLVKTPLVLLIAAAGALLQTAVCLRKWLASHDDWPLIARGTLLCAWLGPLTVATILRPPDYDGIRHFLFALVPMVCLAGVFVGSVIEWVARFRKAAAPVAVALIFAALLPTLGDMIRMHPYQYVYYNELVGGTHGANGRFVTDYWVTSFRETIAKLDVELREQKLVPLPEGRRVRVAVCGSHKVAKYFLDSSYEVVGSNSEADFFLSTTKWQCHKRRRGEVIVKVGREGALFALVKQLRPL